MADQTFRVRFGSGYNGGYDARCQECFHGQDTTACEGPAPIEVPEGTVMYVCQRQEGGEIHRRGNGSENEEVQAYEGKMAKRTAGMHSRFSLISVLLVYYSFFIYCAIPYLWFECVQMTAPWVIPGGKKGKNWMKIDGRSALLGGGAEWFPPNMKIMAKSHRLKCVDYVRLFRGALRFCFSGMYEDEIEDAFLALCDAVEACLTLECDVDGLRPTRAMKRKWSACKIKVLESMCRFAKEAPLTMQSPLFHTLMHMPDMSYRWGSCKNFWCFTGERL